MKNYKTKKLKKCLKIKSRNKVLPDDASLQLKTPFLENNFLFQTILFLVGGLGRNKKC